MNLPIIERRRIEAEILKHVYDTLLESHGKEVAVATLDAAVSQSALVQGARYRAKLDRDPDLNDMATILSDWTANDALVIEIINVSAEQLDFDVKQCRYAEMYQEMGLGEIGHLLSCNRDGKFCTSYNPNMKLERTQTLLGGASYCDFRYKMKPNQ